MSPLKEPIWRLVRSCAEELTKAGTVPFTRRDLIACVQKKSPRYGANSINPIIQGLTDNLRGGAPGAVGKNILHSVGRGQFILSEQRAKERATGPQMSRRSPKKKKSARPIEVATEQMKIDKHRFSRICDIVPNKDQTGKLEELLPQGRYVNENNLGLNRYGAGPFCKFKIPSHFSVAGVYAIAVGTDIKCVGECENLSSRYNMGYGTISPRNCYIGGQETNCRINNLILSATKAGKVVSLWFLHTEDYKKIEAELRLLSIPLGIEFDQKCCPLVVCSWPTSALGQR